MQSSETLCEPSRAELKRYEMEVDSEQSNSEAEEPLWTDYITN